MFLTITHDKTDFLPISNSRIISRKQEMKNYIALQNIAQETEEHRAQKNRRIVVENEYELTFVSIKLQ